ncbi:MAG TPA: molybdopterin-guanine dinucleotide biosynthesis protein B [Candidatus Baltobacteraceae bacterium]|nr:molybdopterin-guanine dinucleotide biosynthesis protein B [Candidatus Baltobacteraceae bacterium]
MVPVYSVVGRSNSGKTTLLEQLLRELIGRGRRVGTIKHHRHGPVVVDVPGKDSWRHKTAGAQTVVLASAERAFAVWDSSGDTPLEALAFRYFPDVDVILTEGFKTGPMPKIEVNRRALGVPLLCGDADRLLAVVADWETGAAVPHFGLDQVGPLADFLERQMALDQVQTNVELLVGGRRIALDPATDVVLARVIRSLVGDHHDLTQGPPIELRIAGRLP